MKNLLTTILLFVTFFPKLVAGPIQRANELIPQFKKWETLSLDSIAYGIKRILYVLSNFGLIPKGFGAMSYHKKIVSLNPDFLISLNQKPDNYLLNH